jgi:hypothetical protein
MSPLTTTDSAPPQSFGNCRTHFQGSRRRTAVLVGALFLISTATFIVSNALITPLQFYGLASLAIRVTAASQFGFISTGSSGDDSPVKSFH